MPELSILFSAALGLFLVLTTLMYWKNESPGSLVQDQFFQAKVDDNGSVYSLRFQNDRKKSILPIEFILSLNSIYTFSLGVLSGVSVALFGLVLLLVHRSQPINGILLTFAWLSFVAITWGLVFLRERHVMSKMVLNGTFERLTEMGVDPVRIAGEAYLRSRSFWTWSFVIAWIGVAIASPLTAFGPAVAFLILKLIDTQSRSRRMTRTVHMKDMHKQFFSAGKYLQDGGWVAPLGMLLLMAALALAHFGGTETVMLCGCIAGFIILVMWSERASRSSANMLTLEEWRRVFRHELTAPANEPPVEAVV